MRLLFAIFLLSSLAVTTACGRKGPPLAPESSAPPAGDTRSGTGEEAGDNWGKDTGEEWPPAWPEDRDRHTDWE